jgi:high-affinity Fe2+/Pb2+ permease
LIRYRKTPLCRAARTSCALLCASFAGPALAQAASDLAGLSATTLLQTLLALAVVIGLLFLAAFLLRKLNGGRGFGSTAPCGSSAA